MKNNLTIWCTYHDDLLIEKYELNKLDSSIHRLYATHKDNELINLNHISKVINEASTMYYVWKNQIESDFVGFEHYCRIFYKYLNINKNQCCVANISLCNVKNDYLKYHNHNDYFLILDIIKEKYGEDSKYYKYLNADKNVNFVYWEMFIMSWDMFDQLCNFVFDIYFEFDKRIGCNLDLNNYIKRYNNDTDEMRSFYIERLISCFIVCNFNIKDIKMIEIINNK